ncbi:hypothetical protein F5879DRAFT_1015063 [Lentinula edodes]|nr:uncharacterized protein C8R40DRAFT_289625 [Lentinula edodes]KAH7874562.1 hypothetical protein C8R40DRAFT_289625 [Lentinula edodes]KAJ3906818.1 hypothetical protein F5879DRAFT_1015063 [Lentinula edodes]
MRRSQTLRNHTRASMSSAAGNTSQFGSMGPGTSQLALHSDDLGVLREGDESDADVLRRQLLDKDRECDRLKTTLSLLQSQLSLRPPVEHVQALEREYKDLELLLEGTQRENERCMGEMERMKIREKMLERELARLAGDNWQSSLDISPFPPAAIGTLGRSSAFHQRSNTAPTNTRMDSSSISSGRSASSSSPLNPSINANANPSSPHLANSPSISRSTSEHVLTSSPTQESDLHPGGGGGMDPAMLAAHIEKVRLLIMGMETRISKREDHLQEMVKRAESEGRRWEEVVGGVRA